MRPSSVLGGDVLHGAIFDIIMHLSRYELELSMLEIYNESIRDLLRRPGTDAMKLEATTHVFFSSSSVQIFITNTTPKPSDQSPNIDIFGLKFVFVILKLISGGDGNGGVSCQGIGSQARG